MKLKRSASLSVQRAFELCDIEFMMDCIARSCMGKLKFEVRLRRQAGSSAAKSNTRSRVLPKLAPRIGNNNWLIVIGHGHDGPHCKCESARWNDLGIDSESLNCSPFSKIPTPSSQSSNSGAGFSPRALRANKASWNDVVW